MVDAKDPRLVEAAEQRAVELLGGGQVTAEGLLDDDTGAARTAGLAQLLHDQLEHRGRDCEIVGRALGPAELLAKRLERRGVPVVAVDVPQEAAERVEA